MREPVRVLSVGAFGQAVARRLRAIRPDIVETSIGDALTAMNPTAWPAARINIIAAWRPVIDYCELLDEVSYERQCPFIPLVVDAKTVYLGPVVVPGAGSCWGCWFRRSKQHAAGLSSRFALWQYYSAHPEAGPRGYLEPFAAIGAARLSETIEQIDSSAMLGGRLWQIDLMTREITASTVVGVDDCPRCGLHRLRETRSFAEMQRALTYLWQDYHEKSE